MSAKARELIVAALAGGMIAGTIDIGAACLINGRSVPFVLHSIAGGLLAEQALAGGARTALLGAALQQVMGILIAAIFVGATAVMPVLRQRWIMAGTVYGLIIFAVMNYVVVPLSAWHTVPHFFVRGFLANLLAMLFFGVIVAYFASRQSPQPVIHQSEVGVTPREM